MYPFDRVNTVHKLSRYEFDSGIRTIQRKDEPSNMALLLSLTQDLTKQDKRKIITIFLTMTIGLPIYVALMSLTGIIDLPMTTFTLGLSAIIGFVMFLLVMMPAYLLGNKITS